jgi:hypothetical protein
MTQKKSSRSASSPSPINMVGDKDTKLVPITSLLIEDLLSDIDKIKSCFEKKSEGVNCYLDQIYNILGQEDQCSIDFMSRFKSLGLFDSCIQLFLELSKVFENIDELALLAKIMSYFVIEDQSLLDKLVNKKFIMAIVRNLDDPGIMDMDGVLPLAKFFELLLEDDPDFLRELDSEHLNNLKWCSKESEEAALCIANLMIELDDDISVLGFHCRTLQLSIPKPGDTRAVNYLSKLLKVLTNHIDPDDNLPEFVRFFIDCLFFRKEAVSTFRNEPRLIPPMACFFANIIHAISERKLEDLEPLFEVVIDAVRNNLDDDELVDSAVSLMRSLSLTGGWAANASDVLNLLNSKLHPNMIPIAFYSLKHAQGSSEELIQIKEALGKLSLSEDSTELQEEALAAIKNLEN